MILVGQYDSPFVRRVAIALHHYHFSFERRILSVFTQFDEMLSVNPLGKVPALVLEDGKVLAEAVKGNGYQVGVEASGAFGYDRCRRMV